VLLVACGSNADAPQPSPDAACESGLACATWLQSYEREVVNKLAGGLPIADGLTLAHRFSEDEKEAVRAYLEAELTLYDVASSRHNYGTGTNLVATLSATTTTTATVIVGAHYDSIASSPAAGDDGTGTAFVLAAARYFAVQPTRSWNYQFVFFDEEEIGLVGSQAYAEKIRSEQQDIRAVHIFDLISWDEDGDGAVELWSPTPELQLVYEEAGARLGIPVQPVDFGSSDHASFLGINVPTVGVSEEFVADDHTPYYHTPEDTPDKINFVYLESISRLAIDVLSIGP